LGDEVAMAAGAYLNGPGPERKLATGWVKLTLNRGQAHTKSGHNLCHHSIPFGAFCQAA